MDGPERSPDRIDTGTWHSWDSPVGLAVGLLGLVVSVGGIVSSVALLLWLLHAAATIG